MTKVPHQLIVALLLALLWVFCAGCGGGASAKLMAPEAPGDYDDAYAEEEAGGEADAESVHLERPLAAKPSALDEATAQAEPVAETAEGDSTEGPSSPETTSDVPTTAPKAVAAPLLIYTADLVMGVFEAAESIDKVEKLARDAGGYLVQRDDQSITVRVPSGKFQQTLGQMMKLGDVLHRDVKARDVTEQYYDLQVRLRNAEAVLERLKTLLERAGTVKDALAVEAELARVAGEVERLKGRLKLLRELIAFSTITIKFEGHPVEEIDTKVDLPFPWLSELGLGNLLRF